MQYFSTRGAGPVSFDDALRQGIASDGGLYLPESLAEMSHDEFSYAESPADVAAILLRPYLQGSALATSLDEILTETFCFPIPLRLLRTGESSFSMLELFHGPTAAFKDVGAGFLAACLTRLEGSVDAPLTILVATSGDTGGAVAAAFDQRPGIRVAVLFPEGRVSARQELQLTCWSDNVLSLKVAGSFDDCQSLVKAAMADKALASQHRFSSANSINIGRLLPQCCYYASASLEHFRQHGRKPGFIIPSGNLGNAFACLLARGMGLPIGPVFFATNANRTIADYFKTARWEPRASIATLASAMDVGDPSNMERVTKLFGNAESLQQSTDVLSVSDSQIRNSIVADFNEFGTITCPHTATATQVYRMLGESKQREHDWIAVATAHPAKFETIVEPLVNRSVPLPVELAAILSRPSRATEIRPDLASLAEALEGQ